MRHLIAGTALLALVAIMPCLAHADDEAIAKEIISKLRKAQDGGEIKGFSVDLEVDEGAVWMKGHFANTEQKAKALRIAQYASGVTQVVDDLTIKAARRANTSSMNKVATAAKSVFKQASTRSQSTSEPKPIASKRGSGDSDQQITQRVISELRTLKDSGQLKNFKIDVDVTDASVWIKGDVASPTQQQLILEKARRVAGVRQVVNDITVRTAATTNPIQPVGTAAIPVSNTEPTPASAAPQQAGNAAVPAGYMLVPVNGYGMHPAASAQPARPQMPLAVGARPQIAPTAAYSPVGGGAMGGPVPMHTGGGMGAHPAQYEHPQLPGYAWPSYASHPNYGAVTYPKQHSAAAWPYIGPFYPYPQVPLGWRKVQLQWDDGWWFLDFKSK